MDPLWGAIAVEDHMTGMDAEMTDVNEQRINRVRRLVYQASYTAMKETDLLLGHFAKHHLPTLSDDQLTDFENLLEAGDDRIYAWVMGNDPVPAEHDTHVFKLIKDFKEVN